MLKEIKKGESEVIFPSLEDYCHGLLLRVSQGAYLANRFFLYPSFHLLVISPNTIGQ